VHLTHEPPLKRGPLASSKYPYLLLFGPAILRSSSNRVYEPMRASESLSGICVRIEDFGK
jgi:hypothetical protein